jgi:hypothetical protein
MQAKRKEAQRSRLRARKALAAVACLEIITSMGLVGAIAILASTLSIGFAQAQTLTAMAEPDTGLVIAMLVVTIGVMGGLSAIAVHFSGRPRQRS